MRFFSIIYLFLLCTPAYVHSQTPLAERQFIPDAGNGYFHNPVIPGKYGDPAVVRVGQDYYMTHSGGGMPSLLIWHSRDLVNWKPIGHALHMGDPWAPDLAYADGTFYIYVTIVMNKEGKRTFDNYVLTARNPAGPWSEPINLNIQGMIDPGVIFTPQGKKYLYFEKGYVVELTSDGLKPKGELKKVYDGWQYPDDWVVECPCLEGPKLFYRNGYYYMTSAQGGTKGPATSHMAVVARSKSPTGPWENSPHNPLIHTRSRSEQWWSQGHATILDAPDGSWWAVYHGYENNFRTLGRPTLLLPVEWTTDGWFRIAGETSPEGIVKKPAGENIGHGMALSDNFSSDKLSLQWRYHKENGASLFHTGNNQLRITAQGTDMGTATRLSCQPVNHAYEVQVEAELSGDTEAGLLLYTEGRNYTGIGLKGTAILPYWRGEVQLPNKEPAILFSGKRVYLKVRNDYHDVTAWYSGDGKTWTKLTHSFEVQQGHGVISIALYAKGSGEVIFKNFQYHGLE